MERPAASPESDIGTLAARLDALERRFSALEAAVAAPGAQQEPPVGVDTPPEVGTVAGAALSAVHWGESLPLVGRTLMVLAGAFVIRALTEAGVLPQLAGAVLGIVYALVWIMQADRAAAAGHRISAAMHGVATAVIAFPLLWEATVKFGFLSPEASALGLAVVTVPGLLVAARQRLRPLAWMIALGAVATTLALVVGTKMVVLFAACLLTLGGATLWLGFVRGWQSLGWVVAVLVDLTMILLTAIVLLGDAAQVDRILKPASLVWLQLLLIVVYLGSFTARTLARGRNARSAEISQAIAALLIGLLGAVAVTRSASLTTLPLAVVSLLLAAACYGASFTLHGSSVGKRRNFLFYTTAGLVAGLVACDAVSEGLLQIVAFGIAGLLTAALGAYRGRVTLAVHGAVFVVAAALMSGLLKTSVVVLALDNPLQYLVFSPPAIVALVVAGLVGSFSSERHGRTWGFFAPVPKAVVLAILGLGVAALVVAFATRGLLPIRPTAQVDPAALSSLRTVVLAVCALALAWISGRPRFAEAGLLVYPFLVAGGLKLVLDDLRVGRPTTLAISLAVYGGAMFLAPRVIRRAKMRIAGPEPASDRPV